MLKLFRIGAIVGTALLTAAPASAELRLLMIEQAGCVYCMRWDREVGDAYHLTDEGARAPLVRTDLRAPLPDGVTLARGAAFTPTFVLLQDGAEISRIEGYPGEDFFWGLLNQMLDAVPVPDEAAVDQGT